MNERIKTFYVGNVRYSIRNISLVLFSITIFLGLSIPNLGFGNDMYLFVKVQQLKQQ